MISDRKIRANRENARSSTGPKTAQGRARAARNALRDGLSLPVYTDPLLSEEVESLAISISGANANTEIKELARRIAEAQIDLSRVRRARQQFLTRALGDPEYDFAAATRDKGKIAAKLAKLLAQRPLARDVVRPLFADLEEYVRSHPEGPQKLATILADMTQRLGAMDRYERRALAPQLGNSRL